MSKYDVPLGGLNLYSAFVLKETSNLIEASVMVTDEFEDQDVHGIGTSSRKCIFPNENENMRIYKYYNRNTCIAECAEEQIMKTCNCTLSTQEVVESWSQGLFHYN